MNISPAQNQPAHLLGSIPCPRCRNLIRFPFQALLLLPALVCEQCGLELEIDHQRSAGALEELRRYAAGLDAAGHWLDQDPPG